MISIRFDSASLNSTTQYRFSNFMISSAIDIKGEEIRYRSCTYHVKMIYDSV